MAPGLGWIKGGVEGGWGEKGLRFEQTGRLGF
jgi:hypothetical protein